MSADDLKRQLKDLADRRRNVEIQVAEASARLQASGAGMETALLDNEVRSRELLDSIFSATKPNPSLQMVPTAPPTNR